MNDRDDILERLQADVTGYLLNVPGLADATILADNEADIESRVETSLAVANEKNGKSGLSIVVMRPDVTGANSNLPGPVFDIEVQVQILENVLYNRDEDSGNGMRTSQAALRVQNALHHQAFGNYQLFCPEKNSLREAKVKEGHVSHVVTMLVRNASFAGPGKVAAITDEWGTVEVPGPLSISGTGVAEVDVLLVDVGPFQGYQHWTDVGQPFDDLIGEVAFTTVYRSGGFWRVERQVPGFPPPYTALIESDAEFPMGLEFELGVGMDPEFDFPPAVSQMAPTMHSGVTLECATEGAEIYYSTDGSYPAPDTGTLYVDLITGLEAGDQLRSVAYVAGLNPSDVLETRIL